MNKVWIGIVVLGVLAGCAGTQTEGTGGQGGMTPPGDEGVPASSSTGYAAIGDTVTDPNVVLSAITPTIFVGSDRNHELRQQVGTLAITDDPAVWIVTLDGVDVTLNLQSDGNYTGNTGTQEVVLAPGRASTGEEVALAYLTFFDASPDESAFSQIGFVVAGFNTDPDEVAALRGTATYRGSTSLVMTRGDSNNSYGFGPATFVADFAEGTISGEMTVNENGSSAGFEIEPTSITVASTPITGNSFTTEMTIATAGLGIDTVDTAVLDGQFFGANGAAVGGSYSATGTDDGGATTVILQGGFVADDAAP